MRSGQQHKAATMGVPGSGEIGPAAERELHHGEAVQQALFNRLRPCVGAMRSD